MTGTHATSCISADGARVVVDAALAAAADLGVAVVVWVLDPGGNDVAMTRMDGSPLLSRQVAADKAWTAVAFGQETTWWSELLTAQPPLSALGRGNRLMPVPGGVPLVVAGAVVGGVGVSGATSEQDHAIARAAAQALTEMGNR
ncbi:heme-binding protein [Nocardioides agariphilus]|uniref:Heme-binding protein n=1 Tax=Nocardioides agariphilus TaxID=433664 RepID=A0A930YI37_9ACTN|nr:heme-binding protein [Nocardioides agariphilus]